MGPATLSHGPECSYRAHDCGPLRTSDRRGDRASRRDRASPSRDRAASSSPRCSLPRTSQPPSGQVARGSVPSTKYSNSRRGQPASATAPLAGSISTRCTPGGASNDAWRRRRPSRPSGSAARSGRRAAPRAAACRADRRSRPTPTATSSGVKPTNQASFESSLVPVLPAIGPVMPAARTARAVPRSTTPCEQRHREDSSCPRRARARSRAASRSSVRPDASRQVLEEARTDGRSPPFASVA